MGKDTIEYLERLALISFTEEERKKLAREIEKIIEMFNIINHVKDLDRWEPLYHIHEISLPLREDGDAEEVDVEKENLRNNAILVEGYVKAPKTVIE